MSSCIRESIPPVKKKGNYTGVAALMMIALVLQSLRLMIICSTCTCRMSYSWLWRGDSLVIAERDHRIIPTWGQRYSPSKPNGHCLRLELRFHSCGVTNYTFGLKWQTYCLVLTWPRRALLFSSKPPNLLRLKWDIVKSPHIPEESFLTWRHKSALYCRVIKMVEDSHWIKKSF